jgi:hypothetical protein
MQRLETERKGVGRGIKGMKPKVPLLPPFLCVSKVYI